MRVVWSLIANLLSSLIGPLLTLFQRKRDEKAADQAFISQARAEGQSESITDAGQVSLQHARAASDSLVADMANAGVRGQSDDVSKAIAAANSELR